MNDKRTRVQRVQSITRSLVLPRGGNFSSKELDRRGSAARRMRAGNLKQMRQKAAYYRSK
jgi:hypothetical protein